MSVDLIAASRQWSTRPADQRFSSFADLVTYCQGARDRAVAAKRLYSELRAEKQGDDVVLAGPRGTATLTNHSFGQLATLAGAPGGYLRGLPATLAVQNLNHGLKERAGENDSAGAAMLLLDRTPVTGEYVARAITTEKYSRVWDADIATRLVEFVANNPAWTNPPAYAHSDADKARPGYDPETGTVPSGLYASDRDMFAFLVDGGHILDTGNKGAGMNRGFYVSNSEVGDKSLSFTAFAFDKICGNHIIWGARDVSQLRIRHVGDADKRAWSKVAIELRAYAESSTAGIEKRIVAARSAVLGGNKLDALDAALKMVAKARVPLSQKAVKEALDTAEAREDRYGNPRTVWGLVSGLTENSQRYANVDDRTVVDRAAGKILEMVSDF